MACKDRTEADALITSLAQNPGGHDFFLTLRKLQLVWPEYPQFGYANLPKNEPVRLKQNPTLGFNPTLIESFQPAQDNVPASLTLNYHGVFGPNGTVPISYTEHALERIKFRRDHTTKNFLDIFHHRMMTLLFRAWADCNIAVDMDRVLAAEASSTESALEHRESRFIDYVGSFSGLGMPTMRNRSDVPDFAQFYFSSWLSRQSRNAEGLEKILADFFEIPVRVLQFQGRWLPLPAQYQLSLGESPEAGAIGENAIVGEQFWDCSLSFRIQIGPLTFSDFQRMLPNGGGSFDRLCTWVKIYAGQEFYWDTQFLIHPRDIPELELGSGGSLGLDTWLNPRADQDDCEEVILQPKAA